MIYFDLKAVNSNVVVKIDIRTPEEVIQSIEEQGKIVTNSLETLRALLRSWNGTISADGSNAISGGNDKGDKLLFHWTCCE